MNDLAIRVEDLSKAYRIGQIEQRQETLLGAISATLKAPFSNYRKVRKLSSFDDVRSQDADGSPAAAESNDILWALRDVSFDVKHGEVVGIIGRNGAGKSTLLKILSRVTEPTAGHAEIYGRVASLLEVGTGFHPDLTGRENVYLNGTILGMKRREIDRKFDEIAAFSGVEKFLDTPVKRYSSGMRVRLAFAVAAYLEPEILIVDEVLAVGDAAFQRKCLGKMGEVASGGRTVLFVSHNLGVLASLCPRSMLLESGALKALGETDEVINLYLQEAAEKGGSMVWKSPTSAPGSEVARLHAVRVRSRGQVTSEVAIDAPVEIEIEYWNLRAGTMLSASLHLLDKTGATVLSTANFPSATIGRDEWFGRAYPEGLFRSVCTIPANFLNDGLYRISVVILNEVSRREVFAKEVVELFVQDTGAMRDEYRGSWGGVIRLKMDWRTEQLDCSPCRTLPVV